MCGDHRNVSIQHSSSESNGPYANILWSTVLSGFAFSDPAADEATPMRRALLGYLEASRLLGSGYGQQVAGFS